MPIILPIILRLLVYVGLGALFGGIWEFYQRKGSTLAILIGLYLIIAAFLETMIAYSPP